MRCQTTLESSICCNNYRLETRIEDFTLYRRSD